MQITPTRDVRERRAEPLAEQSARDIHYLCVLNLDTAFSVDSLYQTFLPCPFQTGIPGCFEVGFGFGRVPRRLRLRFGGLDYGLALSTARVSCRVFCLLFIFLFLVWILLSRLRGFIFTLHRSHIDD